MQNHCAKVLLTIWLLILSMRRCHWKQKKSLGSMYVFSHFWFIFFPEFFNLFYWSIYWSVFIFLFFCHAFHDTGNPIWPPGLYFLNLVFIWLFFPYHFVLLFVFAHNWLYFFHFQTPGYYPWMHEQNKLVNGEYHIVLFVISSFFLICFVHIFAIKFLFIFCMIWVGCLFFWMQMILTPLKKCLFSDPFPCYDCPICCEEEMRCDR
jgi:hypothetical protein